MTPLEAAGIAFFGLWWATTVILQFEPAWIRRINFHGFVPSCRFFAPNPMVTDARVYFSCQPEPGSSFDDVTWQLLIEAPKGKFRMFWNPHQRLEKTVHNVVRQIMRLNEDTPSIELTAPYLRFLNLANSRGRNMHGDGYVRFVVTRHRGIENEGRYVTFLSKEHRLCR